MVDFAEAMSRLYHSFFSQMKRESWSDLKLKELKIVHEFKASTERLESVLGLLVLREIQH